MHALAHSSFSTGRPVSRNLLPLEVEEAARALLAAAGTAGFAVTPLSDNDVLEADRVDTVIAELVASGDLDPATAFDAIFDDLGSALIHVGGVDPVTDEMLMASTAWNMLRDSVVNQPILTSEATSLRMPGIKRREIVIEFSLSGARLWENGGATEVEMVTCREIACGLSALLPALSSYLRFQMMDSGLVAADVGDCLGLDLIRNMIETGVARVGFEDVRVPGLADIVRDYYGEVLRKTISATCADPESYDAVSISAPGWLLPYLSMGTELHPAITTHALAV